MNLLEAERLLNTYSLEEILELNNITEAEVLSLLVEQELVVSLDPLPLDASL